MQVTPLTMGTQRAAWKRCAQHVYIAHFIDMQQQLTRHHSFFPGGSQAYLKSYNLNVPLAPSEPVYAGAGRGGAVGAGGDRGVGGAGAVEATERGLNAAAMAAAAAASMQGAKERAYSMEMLSRKSPAQHGHGGGSGAAAATALSLQVRAGGGDEREWEFGYCVGKGGAKGEEFGVMVEKEWVRCVW